MLSGWFTYYNVYFSLYIWFQVNPFILTVIWVLFGRQLKIPIFLKNGCTECNSENCKYWNWYIWAYCIKRVICLVLQIAFLQELPYLTGTGIYCVLWHFIMLNILLLVMLLTVWAFHMIIFQLTGILCSSWVFFNHMTWKMFKLLDGMGETFPIPEYVKAFNLACMQ